MLTVLSPWKLYYNIITLLTESVTILDVIGSILQPNFSRTDSTLPYKSFCSTSLGIPTTSKHSLLEYWALVHHWRSMFASLLDNSEFTSFVTKRSGCKILNLLFNLRISSNTSALLADIWDCIASTITIKSFSSSLSKFSSVHDDLV